MEQLEQALAEENCGTKKVLQYGNIELDMGAHRVLRGGTAVALSPKEWELLAYLLVHRGKAVSRGQLLAVVWDIHTPLRTRTVDMHIRKLRKALPELRISTIFKFGYRLDEPHKG